jgi:hypothetical protein
MYKIFLQEGKKEDAIKKVKEMFSSPEDGEMIDKIFDATSSLGTKFIPFIEGETKRYLIDQNMGVDEFINMMISRLKLFAKYNDRITLDVISSVKELWDGVETRGFPKFDSVMKAPKDINSYNINTLGYLTQVLSMISSKKEQEREAKKQAERIFESGDVLVIRALTHNASCYFGAGTRWCTAGQQPDYFNKYTKDGKLYYFIDKSNRRQKVALYVKDRDPSVFDAADKEHPIDFLYYVYPEVEDFVTEKILGGGKVKSGFEDIKNGTISRWNADTVDPLITSYDRDNDDNVTLNLDFNLRNLDFWDVFDWNEGDGDRMYLDMALSSYSSGDYFDEYTAEEDWKEGYMFSNFDDEQMDRLQKYMKIINPKLYECSLELKNRNYNDECGPQVAEFLSAAFDREVSDIISEYTYDMNQDTEQGIIEYLEKDYSDIFAEYGLPMTGTFYKKQVSLNDLIKAYRKYNPNFNLPIHGLLRKIVQIEDIDPPSIADSIYEFKNSNHEYTSTYNAIEKLLDTMEETINENENLSGDYVDHYDFIKKLGGFDNWFVMPGDDRYNIKITDLDMEDDRVTFGLQNVVDPGNFKKMRLPFEKFKDFIYNLQLF